MDNPTFEQEYKALKKGDLTTALRLYEEVINADPQNALAYENASIVQADLGNNHKALAMSAKALELDSSLIIPHVTRAYVLDRMGKNEDSRIEIKKAFEKDPDVPEVLSCLGLFSLRDNKIEDAEKYLKRAVAIRPLFYPAHYNLNLVYYHLKDSKKVAIQSLVLLRLEPNTTSLLRLTYVFSRLPLFRFLNLLILLISASLSFWVGPNLILVVTFLLTSMSFLGGIFIGFLARGTQWIQFAYSLILAFSLGMIGSILYIIANNIYSR